MSGSQVFINVLDEPVKETAASIFGVNVYTLDTKVK